MSHKHTSTVGTYIVVWAVLMVLLLVTVVAADIHLDDALFPGANITLAMLIALVKMLVVMLWFMHVKDASKLTWISAGASFVWLGILFGLTLPDYHTRGHFHGWESPTLKGSYTEAHLHLTDLAEQRKVGAFGDVPQQTGPGLGTQGK